MSLEQMIIDRLNRIDNRLGCLADKIELKGLANGKQNVKIQKNEDRIISIENRVNQTSTKRVSVIAACVGGAVAVLGTVIAVLLTYILKR